MARKKVYATIKTYPCKDPEAECCRIWISRDLAKELDIDPRTDWMYLTKDWMGVLSTQAKVEGLIDDAEGLMVLASEDRMVDAHFKENDSVKVWKLTEWE